jgi:hypothetical protein
MVTSQYGYATTHKRKRRFAEKCSGSGAVSQQIRLAHRVAASVVTVGAMDGVSDSERKMS